MKYKTAFRLAVRLIGVYAVAMSLPWLITTSVSIALDVLMAGGLGFGGLPGPWEVQTFFSHLLSVGVGLYLFFRGERIVNRAIPSNRPYCHECAYQLTGLPSEGCCPECGTSFRR